MENPCFRFLLALLAAASLSACTTTAPTQTTRPPSPSTQPIDMTWKDVPTGASTIVISKAGISADSLLAEIFDVLVERRHRVVIDDRARRYMATEGLMLRTGSILSGNIMQRMGIRAKPRLGGAEARVIVDWRQAFVYSNSDNTPDWVDALWNMPSFPAALGPSYIISRGNLAFAEALLVAEATGGQLSYELAK